MNIEQWMWVIWLVIFVITLIIEAAGPEVVSVWFSGGALISLILSFIPGLPWWIEVVVFALISAGLLIFLRPILTRLLHRDTVPLNVDRMVGKRGNLIKEITPLKSGEVNIDGVIWTAISSAENETIAAETVIKVLSVSGNKLIVTPFAPIAKEEK